MLLRKNIRHVQAVILDWSGTVSDKYAIAPALCFQKTFQIFDIHPTMEQCRKTMGIRKDLHISEMLFNEEDIRSQWIKKFKREPEEKDVLLLHSQFIPIQLKCLASKHYGLLLPGTRKIFNIMRSNNIKIGSTTGFTRPMIDILIDASHKQGIWFDSTVGGDEVVNGCRPFPHMLYKNLDNMGIDDIQTVIKIDDTISGIEEGKNAGCWTVGVSRYSNYMNIDSEEHESQLTTREIKRRNQISRHKLIDAGAHYVIDSLADIMPIIHRINTQLEKGYCPTMSSIEKDRRDYLTFAFI